MTDAVANSVADTVVMGRVSGLFGVRGWVRVYSYTEPREAILGYDTWWLDVDGDRQEYSLVEGKRHGKAVIAQLAGISDRDAAATLLGYDIVIPRAQLPEPGKGQYYWRDLEGLKVVHRDGTELGTVAYIMETGANDVLVLSGDRERLIPFVDDDVILDVDLANGVISVDWEWD